jgi:ketosteroid isomerase-like protein
MPRACCTGLPTKEYAMTTTEHELQGLIRRYAASIDQADTDLGATIWLTTDDASFIHPRGHERGWESIKRNFYAGTMGRFSERKLHVGAVALHVLGDMAWAEFDWTFEARFADGSPHTTRGRESQVFTRLNDGWKLVHLHYSGPAVTGEREGF